MRGLLTTFVLGIAKYSIAIGGSERTLVASYVVAALLGGGMETASFLARWRNRTKLFSPLVDYALLGIILYFFPSNHAPSFSKIWFFCGYVSFDFTSVLTLRIFMRDSDG